MRNKDRLLNSSIIPSSLWDRTSDVLEIPSALAKAYVRLVDEKGLRALGTTRDPNSGPVGGITKESSERHFAQAFDGSVARALLALLDPKNQAGSTSNTFIRCTAGNKISLTDAPCGAGATTFSFLCALAELREKKVLPRLPLDVYFIGAELSVHARELAAEILEQVNHVLKAQAIFVEPKFVQWDVTDPLSTTDLVKKCVHASSNSSHQLLVVANFNGLLEREGKRKEAQPQLDELFRYASGKNSFALWIEPAMNAATAKGGLFAWLHQQFNSLWKRFGKAEIEDGRDKQPYVLESRFRLPLLPSETARVSLAVMPIELKRIP